MNRQCGEPFAPAVRYALRFEHVSIREEDVVSEVYWSEQDAHAPDYRLNADFKGLMVTSLRNLEWQQKLCPMCLLPLVLGLQSAVLRVGNSRLRHDKCSLRCPHLV